MNASPADQQAWQVNRLQITTADSGSSFTRPMRQDYATSPPTTGLMRQSYLLLCQTNHGEEKDVRSSSSTNNRSL